MNPLKIFRISSRSREVDRCDRMVLIRLREEMRRGRGCPICNLILDVEERSIENILYEMVNDPAVRNRIKSSLGFCPFHAHQVIDFVKRNPWLDGLGTSIIYLDMVETYLDMIENGGAMSITDMWASCYLCEKAEEFERIYVETLSIRFEEDQKLLENYASSSSLLCARHLESVYNRLNRVIGKKILQIQKEKLTKIAQLMKSYIEKQDYKARSPPTEEESVAWIIAIKALKGDPSTQIVVIRSERGHHK